MTDPFFRSGSISGVSSMTMDTGLRAHFQRVFNHMGMGLAITGLVAWIVANTALAPMLLGSPLRILAILAPFGLFIALRMKLQTMSASGLKTMFLLFCGAMGLSMAGLFLTFTDASIARAFFITAGTFGAMSLYGHTTKRDLSKFGGFMLMGVFGIMLASLANLFLMSGPLQWVTSVAGVVIFTGLTAWDVQRIKQSYVESQGTETNDKIAILAALSLYMNFINAFQFILSLTGGRRD